MDKLPILILGGNGRTRRVLRGVLERRGYAVQELEHHRNLAAALASELELVLVALPAEASSGRALLGELASSRFAPPIIVVGHDDGIPGAAEAFELGARDYVATVDETVALYEALGLAMGTSRRDSQLRYLKRRAAQDSDWSMLAGDCDAMRHTIAMVQQLLKRSAKRGAPPILIAGETGTGKGLLARCIHYNSVRRNGPMVDVNCAAIPDNLVEAELFGYERGAFTGATTPRAGLFETADQGSLFLDEIAALRLDLQAKLLTVAEEQRVRRIGARSAKQVNVQIIAATHRNLQEMVERGEFREDLYYRLNVLTVEMPALRDRGRDKVMLAERFITQMAAGYSLGSIRLTDAAKRSIMDYHWPGNVRELKNQLERIVLLLQGNEIRAEHFVFPSKTPSLRVQRDSHEVSIALPTDGVSLEGLERAVLREALTICDFNVSRAARFLQISRQTLIYRLRKHEIRPER